MPRLAGYQDEQFLSPQEFEQATGFSNHGTEPTTTHGRQVPMQSTRQGVRNLNTPRNGRRSNSCVHVRDPQGTPTVNKPCLALDPETGVPKRKHQVHCALCDEALGLADHD